MEEYTYIDSYLMPRLSALGMRLGDVGVRCEMSMDEDEVPGLLVFIEDLPPVYLTVMEGEEEVAEWYRFAARVEDDAADYARFMTPVDEAKTAEELTEMIRLFLEGELWKVYPPAAQIDGLDWDATIEDAHLPEQYARLLPRTGALLMALRQSYVEECALQQQGMPCIVAVNEDFVCAMAYEETGDDTYMLHFRSDAPVVEGDDAEALCRRFNREHYFAQVRVGEKEPDLYGDEKAEPVYTFFAGVPDNGEMKSVSRYEQFLSQFDDEVEEFFE